MGLLKGSMSLCRYKIVGGQTLTESQLNKKLLKYQAKPVSLHKTAKELVCGWVMPAGIHDPEERNGDYWDLSDCRIDNSYVLRIRLEKRKVPAELFQILYRQKILEFSGENDRKPSRDEQQMLRDELKTDLLANALPAISYLDACWKDDGTVILFNTARKSREVFEELFRSTFIRPMKASLLAVEPPLMALSNQEWSHPDSAAPALDQMDKLLPAWIPTGLQEATEQTP